ncbi:MAG TPA: hypothetical protein VGN88_09235 [Phycisphaerae bacterium]|jgi:hypothetical protein
MRIFRAIILVLLSLVPLATLVHRDDLGRWDMQRSAMAAPDEFSYLLMAQHFLQGGGFSLQSTLGRDTYFPPGYPLALAAWGKCFGLTALSAHALNTLLLCVDTWLVYFLVCRLLEVTLTRARQGISRGARLNLALLITGIFATNWHVLESALLVMSEPAFMLVLFIWFLMALRWEDWHDYPWKAAVMAGLAVIAWSLRGAGIVCVVATAAYPLFMRLRTTPKTKVPAGTWVMVLGLPVMYQIILMVMSPEKSVAAGEESANSYPKQLIHGLLGDNVVPMIVSHLEDYTESFVPWLRENPDYHFRDVIGKIFGIFGIMGWIWHVLGSLGRGKNSSGGSAKAIVPQCALLDFFILAYIGLYLLWPFNFPRFWSPILPVMLVYGMSGVMQLSSYGRRIPRPAIAGVLLGLLLILSAEELFVQLGNYARRLNYVSDSIREGVRTVMRVSPDPAQTLMTGMGDNDLYAFAWYTSQEDRMGGGEKARESPLYRIRVPEPHDPKTGKRELAGHMLLRIWNGLETVSGDNGAASADHFYFFSYFPGVDTRSALEEFQRSSSDVKVTKIFQKEMILTIWKIERNAVKYVPSADRGQ